MCVGIKLWERRQIEAGHWADGQLRQVVEVMLGTSVRIGEVLATRLCELDLDAPIPLVRISGTIVSRRAEPTHRQDHTKTARSVRRVALPLFLIRTVQTRPKKIGFTHTDALLFATRLGTPHTTKNALRYLRDVVERAGVPDFTPHRFRRTAGTANNEFGGRQLASELLGNTDPSITPEHYIRRNEIVHTRLPPVSWSGRSERRADRPSAVTVSR
ncbi:tyrosine-type recombinase/integrase [Leucobacter komagatae]|uniref:tyrosine-type recombinase/integrase n=1 Tax=Leucobacter komagatae TaxID=55969 RepID=UPI000A039E1F